MGSAATPYGELNVAAAPVPSAAAELPLPAKVLESPEYVTARMRLLLASATYRVPSASTDAMPAGSLKAAAVPSPFAKLALPLPAKVLTLQTQGGSALSPGMPQLAGVIQGVAGAGEPPGQK